MVAEGDEIEYKGDKLKVRPLTVREQALMSQYLAKEDFASASKYIFVTTVKKMLPEATDEDIENINDPEFIGLVNKAAMKVNGLHTEKK